MRGSAPVLQTIVPEVHRICMRSGSVGSSWLNDSIDVLELASKGADGFLRVVFIC